MHLPHALRGLLSAARLQSFDVGSGWHLPCWFLLPAWSGHPWGGPGFGDPPATNRKLDSPSHSAKRFFHREVFRNTIARGVPARSDDNDVVSPVPAARAATAAAWPDPISNTAIAASASNAGNAGTSTR